MHYLNIRQYTHKYIVQLYYTPVLCSHDFTMGSNESLNQGNNNFVGDLTFCPIFYVVVVMSRDVIRFLTR